MVYFTFKNSGTHGQTDRPQRHHPGLTFGYSQDYGLTFYKVGADLFNTGCRQTLSRQGAEVIDHGGGRRIFVQVD